MTPTNLLTNNNYSRFSLATPKPTTKKLSYFIFTNYERFTTTTTTSNYKNFY